MIRIIAATDEAGGIGLNGGLPWHIPEELRHFRVTTFGHTLIMGRRTWESVGALPGRKSIVVSRTLARLPDAEVARSLHHAFRMAEDHAFVIGGATVFREAMPYADEMIISRVRGVHTADSFFSAVPHYGWTVREVKKYDKFDVWEYRRGES